MRTVFQTIFLLLIFSLIMFCSKKDDSKPTFEKKKFDDSTLVAMVNDDAIYEHDLLVAAQQFISQTGLTSKVDYTDSAIQHQALDWLIANALLRQEVNNYTIEIRPEETDYVVAQFKKRFPSADEFNTTLQKEKLTFEQFRSNIERDLKVNKLLELEIKKQVIEIETEEAKNYYTKNSDQFMAAEQAHARHILIRVDENAPDEKVKQAKQKAESILQKLKKGEDFVKLAQTYSEGPAASKGGDLGYFSRGDMVEEFEQKAFSLKPGEISDIVRTQFGFHIIKLEDFKGSEKTPFEKVENDIKLFLKQQKANELFEQYVEKLKKKARIQVREET